MSFFRPRAVQGFISESQYPELDFEGRLSQVSIFVPTGLRSGGGGGQPNSTTGARPSAPFRSNVYQPTEMTMILNGGAVSTSGQPQVHAVYIPLSFQDTNERACTWCASLPVPLRKAEGGA